MNRELPPSVKGESVPIDEIVEAQNYNKSLLAGYMQERIHSLRVDVFMKLMQHGALKNSGISWAIFKITDQDEYSGNLAVVEPDKEILVLLMPCNGNGTVDGIPIPNIRIITNELCVAEDNTSQYLSIDFTLDSESDMQYCIDATNMEDMAESTTPLFWVDSDNDLCCPPNIQNFTPTDYLTGIIHGVEQHYFPFGHYTSPADSLHALEIGQALFEEIRSLDPTYCSDKAENNLPE